jgi:hypothetical protein
MARNLLRLAPEPAGVGVAVGSRINLTNLGMFGVRRDGVGHAA